MPAVAISATASALGSTLCAGTFSAFTAFDLGGVFAVVDAVDVLREEVALELALELVALGAQRDGDLEGVGAGELPRSLSKEEVTGSSTSRPNCCSRSSRVAGLQSVGCPTTAAW